MDEIGDTFWSIILCMNLIIVENTYRLWVSIQSLKGMNYAISVLPVYNNETVSDFDTFPSCLERIYLIMSESRSIKNSQLFSFGYLFVILNSLVPDLS